MDIGTAQSIFTKKNSNGFIVPIYTYYTILYYTGENVVVIVHMFGARASFY